MTNKERLQKHYKEDFKPAYDALMKFYPLTLDDLDGEEWRDVDGYDGYQVSNFGRIKSFCRGKGKILRPALSRHGYLLANLFKNHKRIQLRINRLVAKTFVVNIDRKPEVNHINGCKLNNYVGNLEWATSQENSKHAVNVGLIKSGERNYQAKFTNADIEYIRNNPDNLTGRELAKIFNVPFQRISKIQLGHSWKNTGGKIREPNKHSSWKLAEEKRNEIRKIYATGTVTQKCLASEYGVCQQTISNILREK